MLPPGVPTRVGRGRRHHRLVAVADASVGIDRFGASAPGDVVLAKLGITADHVAQVARDLLA